MFPGGSFVTNQLTGLIDLGHEVVIVTQRPLYDKIIDADVIKYGLVSKTVYKSVKYRQESGEIVYLPRRGREKVIEIMRKATSNFFKNPLITLKTLFLIFKEHENVWEGIDSYLCYYPLLKQKIDVINLTFSDSLAMKEAYFLSKFLNVPFTLTFRAYDLHKKENLEALKQSKIAKKASKLIAISKYNQYTLQKTLGIKEEEISLIHDAINPDFFTRKQKRRENKIICICRFTPQKGVKYLLEACKILQQRKIKHRCIIVGSGREEKNYKEIVNKNNIHSVTFTGLMEQKKVKKELDSSAVCILPCIVADNGDLDILPNVLKEAMAMEIPVVTSNISGIEELVEDGTSGILVPPKDPEAIANAIEKLLKNPKLRDKMGKAGRKKIEQEFNIQIEIKKLEKVFCDTIKK